MIQIKQISNEFIIRALQCDGYEHAGFISSAASALLVNLANPSSLLSLGLPLLSTSDEPETTKPAVSRRKNHRKRLPIVYCPAFASFPNISFIG